LGPIPTPAELETTIWAQAAEAFPADRYIIVYRVSGRDVLILRVAHSSRDIELSGARGGPQGPRPFAIGAYDNNIWPTEILCHQTGLEIAPVFDYRTPNES
jgi:hypothetical protein